MFSLHPGDILSQFGRIIREERLGNYVVVEGDVGATIDERDFRKWRDRLAEAAENMSRLADALDDADVGRWKKLSSAVELAKMAEKALGYEEES